MIIKIKYILSILFILIALNPVASATTKPIPINQLAEFDAYPTLVKTLIYSAEKLSKQNLTYQYGSDNPKQGGMDCSGTINYLLNRAGVKNVPRQANELYMWAEKKGQLHKVTHPTMQSSELKKLKPGDLLFWKGTYAVRRTPPITHVMIYLGKDKNGYPLMFGSSNGRTYQHHRMWGVSVFDFTVSNGHGGDLVGYSCIPHLTCD